MLPSTREDDWYESWSRSIIFSGVMTHRKSPKVENPGFSHGHNWPTVTVYHASDTSFCSSHRVEQTGKISASTNPDIPRYESPQILRRKKFAAKPGCITLVK
ncbi:hypothetical protein Ddc_04263 [Ditylenchus destructor]|nr:hypothetical protein Ddc_04263 [Ditylenchus destructor]